MLRALTPVRDLIWVDDVASGLAAMTRARAGSVYNLGSGQGISVGDLARKILAMAGQPDRQVIQQENHSGSSTIILDPIKAKLELAWQPQMPREVGLAQLIALAQGRT
jgi:nucleoside-diphosphate-sugar epimerase